VTKENIILTAKQFAKAQLTSVVATVCDYLVTALLYRYCGAHLLLSTLLGALTGGLVNSVLNYLWTFRGSGRSYWHVLERYALVWAGSIFFNTLGVVGIVRLLAPVFGENLRLVMTVKIIVSIVVAVAWNFLLQKHFVYKKGKMFPENGAASGFQVVAHMEDADNGGVVGQHSNDGLGNEQNE